VPPKRRCLEGDTARLILENVCHLSCDAQTVRLAGEHGLSVVDVAWEDMARYPHSSVGSNITDVTLRAKGYAGRCSIIRRPNYRDETCDFPIDKFRVKVGNKDGHYLRDVSFRDYLNSLLQKHGAGFGAVTDSTHVLVSAQSCVLPLRNGSCAFNVEFFNYQTSSDDLCLAVVCSAEGTTALVVTDRGAQKLFHDANGQQCDFLAKRLRQVRAREGRPLDGAMNAQEEERNILLLFQIPLKRQRSQQGLFGLPLMQKQQASTSAFGAPRGCGPVPALPPGASSASQLFGASTGMIQPIPTGFMPALHGPAMPTYNTTAARENLGTDHAQLSVSAANGPVQYWSGRVQLDVNAAIRCTVQHYLVTDEGTLSEADLVGVKDQLAAVYAGAVSVGSLVTGDGNPFRKTAARFQDRRFWFFSA